MLNKTQISVLALWRDSASHAPRVLAQLEDLISNCPKFDFSFYFYENDSKDNTVELLNNFAQLHTGKVKVFSEVLNSPKFGSVPSPVRTSLLSWYRNRLKDLAGIGISDYTLLIDSDLFFDHTHFNSLFDAFIKIHENGNGQLMGNETVAMVTANTQQVGVKDLVFQMGNTSYYDIFPFRSRHGFNGMYFSSNPFYHPEDHELWSKNQPVEVMAAFAGFALVNSQYFDHVKWETLGESEHVAFCYNLRKFGKIYAIPTCTPYVEIDAKTLNMEAIKGIAQNQRNQFVQMRQFHGLSVNKNWDSSNFAPVQPR